MTRREIIDFCLTFPASYEDYPFDSVTDPGKWTIMRHRTNTKIFAMIYERNGKLCVNIKCDPFEADFLRRAFTDVIPGFHMNKVHWNTVIIGGDVSDDDLKSMIGRSYDLIKPKNKKRVQKRISPI